LKDRYFELKNLIGVILFISVLVWGCKQGDQTLGINLLPDVKILKTMYHQEKTSISTSISSDAKIRVDHPGFNLLGSFNDPVFGRTDASFAIQFRLLSHPGYPADASLDSIVLRMTYKEIYGDTISSQTIQVFELANSINYETKYLSSFNLKSLASTVPIGSTSFIPKFRTDSLKTDTTLQIVRIRLNPSLGNSLLQIDSLKMTSNDEFLKIFKGLFISSTSVSRRGTMVSIYNTQLSTSTSIETRPLITLYYHDAKSDTLGFNYYATDNSANVASYAHDYTLARFNPNIDKPINPDSLIYIQPTGGIKSKILVPSLSFWKDSANCAINKATLTFHVDTIISDYRRYSMPSRLYLMAIDSTGTEVFPADSKLSSSYYGGFYDSTTATYSFNVTQHLQQLIAGTIKNQGLYLVPSDRNSSAQRVVLKGLGSSKPVELNVTYTRYK
jgi:hypothetical protein